MWLTELWLDIVSITVWSLIGTWIMMSSSVILTRVISSISVVIVQLSSDIRLSLILVLQLLLLIKAGVVLW